MSYFQYRHPKPIVNFFDNAFNYLPQEQTANPTYAYLQLIEIKPLFNQPKS